MAHALEIAHSAYMIGKAQARLHHQRHEQRLIAGTSDARRIALGEEILDLMEARLAALLRTHRELMNEAVGATPPSNTEQQRSKTAVVF